MYNFGYYLPILFLFYIYDFANAYATNVNKNEVWGREIFYTFSADDANGTNIRQQVAGAFFIITYNFPGSFDFQEKSDIKVFDRYLSFIEGEEVGRCASRSYIPFLPTVIKINPAPCDTYEALYVIMSALGFVNEYQRKDADTYLTINKKNIKPEYQDLASYHLTPCRDCLELNNITFYTFDLCSTFSFLPILDYMKVDQNLPILEASNPESGLCKIPPTFNSNDILKISTIYPPKPNACPNIL